MPCSSGFPHDIQNAIGTHRDHREFAGRPHFFQRHDDLQTKELAPLGVDRNNPPAVTRLE